MRHNVQKNEVAALAKQLPEKSARHLSTLTDDCRQMVISHAPQAYAMAWRMRDNGVSLEDLRQEGFLGLCEAALRYDETIGCSFAAYASYWCRKMVLMAVYGNKRSADCQPETLPEEEQADDDLLRKGQRQRIDDALQCLTPKEQLIVRQFYGLDSERHTLTEIASQLGISKARTTILHQRSLHKLEAALRERPLVDYLDPLEE